jgi:hypothetical protein
MRVGQLGWPGHGTRQKVKKRAVAAAIALFSGLALWAANVVLFGKSQSIRDS